MFPGNFPQSWSSGCSLTPPPTLARVSLRGPRVWAPSVRTPGLAEPPLPPVKPMGVLSCVLEPPGCFSSCRACECPEGGRGQSRRQRWRFLLTLMFLSRSLSVSLLKKKSVCSLKILLTPFLSAGPGAFRGGASRT